MVFLQCCTTGVVVGRTRVVRYRSALGRRWQACPTVRSSVLVCAVYGKSRRKDRRRMLLRRKGMRLSQGTQCQDEGGAGISDVPFCSGAVHSDVPYDHS